MYESEIVAIEYLKRHPNTCCNKCGTQIKIDEDLPLALVDWCGDHLCWSCHILYLNEMSKD